MHPDVAEEAVACILDDSDVSTLTNRQVELGYLRVVLARVVSGGYFQIVNFLVYGIAGRFGAPLFAVNNLIGRFADNLFRNDLFCLNFAILARKPA